MNAEAGLGTCCDQRDVGTTGARTKEDARLGFETVEIPPREAIEPRLYALIADHLDRIEGDNPRGFDLGLVALAVEVVVPDPENAWVRREEGRYSPPTDVDTYWSYYCSDWRPWVRRAIFREAYDFLEYGSSSSGEDSEEDESEE